MKQSQITRRSVYYHKLYNVCANEWVVYKSLFQCANSRDSENSRPDYKTRDPIIFKFFFFTLLFDTLRKSRDRFIRIDFTGTKNFCYFHWNFTRFPAQTRWTVWVTSRCTGCSRNSDCHASSPTSRRPRTRTGPCSTWPGRWRSRNGTWARTSWYSCPWNRTRPLAGLPFT